MYSRLPYGNVYTIDSNIFKKKTTRCACAASNEQAALAADCATKLIFKFYFTVDAWLDRETALDQRGAHAGALFIMPL
jgi:hypothetical protein